MRQVAAALFGLALSAAPAAAAVTGFLANPAGNSADWTNFVTGLGLGINTAADMDAMPLGGIASGFYQPALGLGITATGGSFTPQVIDYAALPSGSVTCPCSTGEGAVPFSRLIVLGDESSLTLSFDSAVNAVGFFLGDKFDPFGADVTTLRAYDGADGTGTLLGTFSVPSNGYQLGYQLFVGVGSTTAEIRSLVLTDPFSGTGDGTYVDNIRFSQDISTPEPASLGLLLAGLLGLAGTRRK